MFKILLIVFLTMLCFSLLPSFIKGSVFLLKSVCEWVSLLMDWWELELSEAIKELKGEFKSGRKKNVHTEDN